MRHTVKILFGLGLASAGVFAAATGAQAADIYRREAAPPPPVVDYRPAITWTGFYIGGNVGATWPSDDLEILDDDAKVIGGAHMGFNWQSPTNWVFGVESDVDFSDDFDYLASVRGRLGYAFGRTLLYGTGGVAFAGLNDDLFDEDQVGWVAGGGIETKVRDNVSLGLEALYYKFDDNQVGNVDDSLETLTVRGRLTVHMNRGSEPLK